MCTINFTGGNSREHTLTADPLGKAPEECCVWDATTSKPRGMLPNGQCGVIASPQDKAPEECCKWGATTDIPGCTLPNEQYGLGVTPGPINETPEECCT